MIVQCPDCSTRYQLDPDRVPRERVRVRCPKCRYVFAIDGRQAAGGWDGADNGQERETTAAAQGPANSGPAPRQEAARRSGPSVRAYGDLDLDRPPSRPPTEPVVSRPASPAKASKPSAPVQLESKSEPKPEIQPEPQPEPVAERPTPARELDLEIERSEVGRVRRPTAPEGAREAAVATATAQEAPAPTTTPKRSSDPSQDKARRLARALVSDIVVYNREARDQALARGTLVQTLGQEIKKSWEVYKEKVTPEVANSTNHFREALNEILADGQKIF